MLRSLGGKCQHNAGAGHYFDNELEFLWNYASIMYCSRNSISLELHVCVGGSSLTLAVFSPIQLPGLPCYRCYAELK